MTQPLKMAYARLRSLIQPIIHRVSPTGSALIKLRNPGFVCEYRVLLFVVFEIIFGLFCSIAAVTICCNSTHLLSTGGILKCL